MHRVAIIDIIDFDTGDFVNMLRILVHLRKPYEVIVEYSNNTA